MNTIDLMIEEHRLIKRILGVIRKACFGILKGEAICYEDFEQMMDFVKNYADAHHHGKEEKFLFNEMEERLGALGQKLIRNGMLVEHDLGRLYMSELRDALERTKAGDEESKLDVIANAVGYTHLLDRHITKEDDVVYNFARRQLPQEILEEIDEKADLFEEEALLKGTQEKYLQIVEGLERKYEVH